MLKTMGYEGRFERNVMKLLEANGFRRKEARTFFTSREVWFYLYERGETTVYVHRGGLFVRSGDLWVTIPNERLEGLREYDGCGIKLILGERFSVEIELSKEDGKELEVVH